MAGKTKKPVKSPVKKPAAPKPTKPAAPKKPASGKPAKYIAPTTEQWASDEYLKTMVAHYGAIAATEVHRMTWDLKQARNAVLRLRKAVREALALAEAGMAEDALAALARGAN